MLRSETQRVRREIPGPGYRENLGVTPKCPDTQKSNGAEPLRQEVLPSRAQRLCKARLTTGHSPATRLHKVGGTRPRAADGRGRPLTTPTSAFSEVWNLQLPPLAVPLGFRNDSLQTGEEGASLLGDFEEGPGNQSQQCLAPYPRAGEEEPRERGGMWLEVKEDATSLSGDCRVWGAACTKGVNQKGPSALGQNPLPTGWVNFDPLL